MRIIKNNEDFEILQLKSSDSNWDDWDWWAKIKCKNCGHIQSFILLK
jgi:hypothetical protein